VWWWRVISPESDDLAAQRLTADSFSGFYRKLIELRFPLDVAEVIDLRDIINQALDGFVEPVVSTRGNRRFVAAVRSEMQVLGVDRADYQAKLTRILVMLRCFQQAHNATSRQAGHTLRRRQQAIRKARKLSVKYGIVLLIAAIIGVVACFAIEDAGWPIRAATVLLAYLSLDHFYSLTVLAQDCRRLAHALEQLRSEQVRHFEWRTLVKHVALILGYTHRLATEPFLISADDAMSRQRSLHAAWRFKFPRLSSKAIKADAFALSYRLRTHRPKRV
jgi:hypothetical protein